MANENTQTNNPDTSRPPPVFSDGSTFNAAYERRLAEIQAVPDSELVVLNIDPHASVATVLGALPEILALREQMGTLGGLDLPLIDTLEDYAEAAAEANSRFVLATTPEEDIVALNDQALTMREMFRLDAVALANRGLIDPSKLSAFQGLVGYKNVGFELIDWANLMRDAWPKIEGRCSTTVEEINQAKAIGERLVRAAGLREQGPAVTAEVARIRQQALTLLVRAYDEVRRAVAFLRWREGDSDTIAPSLYAGRGGSKKHSSDGTDGADATANTQQPAPAGNGSGAEHAAAPNAAAPPVGLPAVGLPSTLPFNLK
jgi:hypothetical protein